MNYLFGRNAANAWIALLENIYSLEGNEHAWLDGMLDVVSKGGRNDGLAAFTFDLKPSSVLLGEVAVRGAPELRDGIKILVEESSDYSMDRVFRSGRVVSTLSEYVWPQDQKHAATFAVVTSGPPDVLGVVAHSGDGRGVVVNQPLEQRRSSTIAERRRWMRGAAHIGAALRLRKLVPQFRGFDGAPIEAILDSRGTVHEARNGAADKNAQQILRDAVRRFDRMRVADPCDDADTALEAWEGLVHGRWSLVDKFDTDRRRFIVAIRNDPKFPDPRGLSLQERQVAEYVGLGRSLKEISYILGIPSASAENSSRRAQAKLGLKSRVELAAFFSPQGIRARLAEIVLNNDSLLIGASSILSGLQNDALTTAEQSVLALIISGSSNNDIARRRATSVHTVANQVQSIFRKFDARSRCELITRIAGERQSGVGF